MKTTIEEEILDIFFKNGHEYINIKTIKEIIHLFFEFMKWKEEHANSPNKRGKYLYWEEHFSLEELCDYWVTYINDK